MTQFAEYQAHGWQLCAIPAGSKGPTYEGWNTAGTPNPGPGAGLLHSLSGTCALDIDHMQLARPFLAALGVDIDALLAAPDSVQIVSGRLNRAKLLYAMPEPRPSRKLCRYEHPVDGKKYHAIELRCGARNGESVQDVLPPSIHPGTGKPYEWKFGHPLIADWRALPPLPEALLALWGPADGITHVDAEWGTPLATEPESASIAELRGYLDYHDPDGAYDDWVAVGMSLHDATGGSPEGLALWDEWSRKGGKYGEAKDGLPPQYPADKWHTFTAGGGGWTIGFLKSKAPASLDSFPLTAGPTPADEFPATPDVGVDTRPGALVRQAMAPLVLVVSDGGYYDRERDSMLSPDLINQIYTPKMPTLQIFAPNGSVRPYTPKPYEELAKATWKEEVHARSLHPGAGTFFVDGGRRYLNTYKSPGIEALAPTEQERAAFEFLWSRPDEAVFRDWLLKFFAHAVQKPGVKIRSAPLIVGHATGSGKSTLMRVLPELMFSPKYVTTVTSEGLREQFNDQLARAWWVHFEEMHSGSSKGDRVSVFNKVKPWISENVMSIRPMYGKRYDAPNRMQLTGASNYEDDALHVDDADRRWCIGHIQDKMAAADAADLYKFLDSPRAPGVLHHIFKGVDLTGFNPNAPPPDTAAKRVMVRVNYGTAESEILEMIGNNTAPFDKDLVRPSDLLPYVKRLGVTSQRLSRILKREPFNFVDMPPAYGARLLAWRNADTWLQCGPAARRDYHAGVSGRPIGPVWTDELPAALAEACGLS